MASLPEIPADSALARLFRQPALQADIAWFSLPAGQQLYAAGDPAHELYLLRTGRLGVFRREAGAEPQFLGVIRPGEPVGEMSLLAAGPHSADVVALRDSELFTLPAEVFFAACERDASVMTELARLMIQRTREEGPRNGAGGSEPSVFGFVPIGEPGSLRPLVEALAAEIVRLAYSVTVVGAEAGAAPLEWYSEVERTHDFVLYVGETSEPGWTQWVSRQADRLFRIGRGDRPPPAWSNGQAAAPLQAEQLVDLILLQPAGVRFPGGSEAWLDAAQPARLFHLRRDAPADVQRLARVLTGQSVGVVLSGGGARAYAHVGAIRALRERKVPIDFLCGVSMGAIVGAGVAAGWDDAELDRRIRAAFVESSPLDDIAFPILAMTRGTKVSERLYEHFGDAEIADLWLPFFCLSANLTTGAYHMHRRGPVWKALRASVALPGVMPPATDGDNVLVDGAVLKNYPADVMRAAQLGPIVGVDVSGERNITADDVARPESAWRWIRSGQWRKGPPIVSLLMRAATVSTGRDLAAARAATDVLIQPRTGLIEIRDWSAYEPAVAAGYKATLEALDRLGGPVQSLRRRPSLQERARSAAKAPPRAVTRQIS
ncbi:MAG TPA: patatin-like phospholipase family protein [Phenylobacterium sp.]|uniref:patatin-like phospholipase family protein n=1 Tax=Phenylobacterium sp. TaxID=1871053 RepID=UPI002B46D872|nr:patatin-like phospholipase family protein [Phenylobacterium sp.]HKR89084.1 patatin-like phospholipase family protein [Phenylobacterium sp.]